MSAPAAAPQRVLIVGASRGIGLEFVRQCRAAGSQVVGTARSDDGLARIAALGAQALRLDVATTPAPALEGLLEGQAFDLAVFNAGVYGPRSSGLQPPSQDEFDAVMHTNVLGAMRVLPQVAERLAPHARLAVISSQMGSMALRSNPAGWLYRASKAALNSVLKDVSLALAGRALCVALHPGWVRTDMGGAEASLAVEDSVAQMRHTLDSLPAAAHGGFFNFDGQPLAW